MSHPACAVGLVNIYTLHSRVLVPNEAQIAYILNLAHGSTRESESYVCISVNLGAKIFCPLCVCVCSWSLVLLQFSLGIGLCLEWYVSVKWFSAWQSNTDDWWLAIKYAAWGNLGSFLWNRHLCKTIELVLHIWKHYLPHTHVYAC